jgi:hypothetical protein
LLPICPHCQATVEPDAVACGDCGVLLGSGKEPCPEHPDQLAIAECAVCGRLGCPACLRQHSRRYLCRDHARVEVIDGHVDVRKVGDTNEAEFLRICLENAGIPAWVHSQKDRSFATNFGPLAPVKVLVPRAYLERARRVLEAADRSISALGTACPRCGLALPLDVDACPACASMEPDGGHRQSK